MWDAADLADLIDPDLPGFALGTKADLSEIGGLYREPYAEAFGFVAGSNPVFLCVAAGAPARSESLIVGGATYTIANVKPDGRGLAMLELEAA